jgi:hypothetical protein
MIKSLDFLTEVFAIRRYRKELEKSGFKDFIFPWV